MAPDGTGEIELASSAIGNAVDWSPDGRTIAFTSSRDGDDDIYSMNPDGTDQRNLTNNANQDDNASISSDGKRIAFGSDRSGTYEIYVMDLDGGNVRQLTFDTAVVAHIPTWSPDGTAIAFSADAATAGAP